MKDEGEAPAIEVSGGQGVQVGTGNVQNNTWMSKAPPDLAALNALNPHVAVVRLKRLSHDDLVDLFARASPDDATDVLAAFLATDAAAVVAILGDIHRRKATELIKPLLTTFKWLETLPAAADAIARKGVSLRWTQAEALEYVAPRQRYFFRRRPARYDGYLRKYEGGRLVYDAKIGALAITGAIETYYTRNGWLGVPIDDQDVAPSSSFGTNGVRQDFRNGTVYASKHGAFYVISSECFTEEGGSAGWLGFPVAEAQEEDDGSYRRQRFEGGAIFLSYGQGNEPYAARTELVKALSSRTSRPVSKEIATESSFGTSGRVQRFEVRHNNAWHETAVYSSAGHGVITVESEVWGYYHELGAEGSRLGFPSPVPERWREITIVQEPPSSAVGPATPKGWPAPTVLPPEPRKARQFFEGGCIYWRFDAGAFAVTGPVFETIAPEPSLRGQLGWPVSEAMSIGASETDLIQFFDNGNVTIRDGKREIWLRQESPKPSTTRRQDGVVDVRHEERPPLRPPR